MAREIIIGYNGITKAYFVRLAPGRANLEFANSTELRDYLKGKESEVSQIKARKKLHILVEVNGADDKAHELIGIINQSGFNHPVVERAKPFHLEVYGHH